MKNIEKIIAVRADLHAHPEHSGHEEQTKAIIRDFLRENTNLAIRDYAGGVIAFYNGKAGTGDGSVSHLGAGDSSVSQSETLAFRADFDAVSLPDGSAAHLCGHDGHTAALLGLALCLEELRPASNILLIFQPSEETGEGAKAMAPILKEYNVSTIYGAHNLPGFAFGKVFTSLDTFACASCGMIFHIQGKPAHAAYPENGISPAKAVIEILTAIEEVNAMPRPQRSSAEVNTGDVAQRSFWATLIGCRVGQKAFGTAAEQAEIWITVRSRTEKGFWDIRTNLENTARTACARDGLSFRMEIQDEFPATVNDPDCARDILTRLDSQLLAEPMRWSEDFGHYLNTPGIKGAFFGIGSGDCPALHTEGYEYPDELLEYQIEAFEKLLK